MRIYIKRVSFLLFAVLMVGTLMAQPSSMKKVVKSVFVLKTFDEQGNLLGSSKGFYIDDKGVALSCYQPMKGASRAVVIGADGKERNVDCILGANETYDVVKFQVSKVKSQPIPLATIPAVEGSRLWLVSGKDVKKVRSGVVRRVETFGAGHNYYTLSLQLPTDAGGSALLNEDGQVVALMEPPFGQNDTLSYAVSISLGESLKINGLSINDQILRAIKIRKDLPQEQDQAVVMLYLGASTQDSATYARMVEDFINRFPAVPDGYYYRALQAFQRDDFAAVQRDMELSIRVAEPKDASHYNYSRFIYEKEMQKPQIPYAPWTLNLALSEARDAYAVNPQPAYQHMQARVLYAQQHYAEALQLYDLLASTSMRSADLFVETSRCCKMLGDSVRYVAMLDSAVALFSRPYVRAAAPYLLMRSQALMEVGKYREAVFDMNDYEGLMKLQLNDKFYYMRFQADLKGRLFQQALNDINQAIARRPDYDVYLSEKASLLIRVNMTDEALLTAEELMKLAPTLSDGYLFAGLALCMKGDKEKGIANLKRALELGDPQAETFIRKYQ